MHLRLRMTSFPYFCVFLGVLLLILCRERCCGQSGSYLSNTSGNCPYRYCSHLATYTCSTGGLVNLPCVVYNSTGPIQVRWYHSQNAPAGAEELNITAGGRYTVEESEQSPSNSRYTNCTEGDQLYRYELKFNYSEGDSGSYWCRIVIGGDTLLELSEAWKVLSVSGGPATCGVDSQTDAKCVGQSTPILASTTLLVENTPTSVVGATSESVNTVTHDPVQMHSPVQTPSASSTSSTLFSDDCTLGGVSCFVYLGAGLGALVVIVVLLVVVVIVLVYISIKIRKKKRKGERIVADSKGVKSFELTELQQHPTVSVENTKYVGAKTSKQGLHKRKDISNGYEEIDQFDEGKISSGPHQLPANLAGSQTSTKSPKDKMHPYDVVRQPTGGSAVPNDQQHIYNRTQHPDIRDTTEQTCDEYNQGNTTDHGQYERLDNTRQGSRKKEARSEGHDYDSVSITEKEKHHETGTPSSQDNIYHGLKGPTEENGSATTATEVMYSTPNFSSKGPPQSPSTQDNFYHVLEGPTPSPGSSPERSTAPGKEEENEYDEPVHPNWGSSKSGQKLGGELFDDPSYQSTFAPVMSTQPHTLPQKLADSVRADLLSSPPYTSPVEDKAVVSDPSCQISSPSRLPTASIPTAQFNQGSKKGTWNDTYAFSQDSKNAQEDDYDQPAAITLKNKELNSNEGGDQPVHFDDPTYQVAFAPV